METTEAQARLVLGRCKCISLMRVTREAGLYMQPCTDTWWTGKKCQGHGSQGQKDSTSTIVHDSPRTSPLVVLE